MLPGTPAGKFLRRVAEGFFPAAGDVRSLRAFAQPRALGAAYRHSNGAMACVYMHYLTADGSLDAECPSTMTFGSPANARCVLSEGGRENNPLVVVRGLRLALKAAGTFGALADVWSILCPRIAFEAPPGRHVVYVDDAHELADAAERMDRFRGITTGLARRAAQASEGGGRLSPAGEPASPASVASSLAGVAGSKTGSHFSGDTAPGNGKA